MEMVGEEGEACGPATFQILELASGTCCFIGTFFI